MKSLKPIRKDSYYTKNDEWIDFNGSVVYAGICSSKLASFKQIQEIKFNELSCFKKRGEIIAIVKYNDCEISAHTPVDGKVLEVNEKLINGNHNILLNCAESTGWIVLIVPSMPHARADLLLSKQYQMKGKIKYAK